MWIILKCLTCFAFLMTLNSCQDNKSDTSEVKTEVDSQIACTTGYVNTTAYEFPTVKISDGYYFDTLYFYDSIKKASYRSVVVQTPDKIVNKNIYSEIEQRMYFENEYVSDYQGESPQEVIFSYNLQPVYFYKDDKVISIAHIIDTYTDEGNHHNYDWFAINIARKSKSILRLGDLVSLKSLNDTTHLNALAEENSKESNCAITRLNFERLHFSISKDTLNLLPDYGWNCGNTVLKIPKSQLKN